MGDAAIVHRLYTNAAAGGRGESAGHRTIELDERDASRSVPRDVVDAVDALLRSTTAATSETAWVVRRFTGWVCVIACYPDLVQDAEGRPGLLAHARFVASSEPAFEAAALIENALELPIGEICAAPRERRLQTYVDAVENTVLVRPAAVSELQTIDRATLADVLLASLSTLGQQKRARVSIDDGGPLALARAWAALPLALQRTSSWGVAVGESCPVDVVFARDRGTRASQLATPMLVDAVERYVRLLHDAPESASAILADPRMTDATAFAEGVRSRKGEMPKKEKATTTKAEPRRERDEWQPIDPEVLAEMNRQYEAMEKSLRFLMEERFTHWESRQRAQSPRAAASRGAGLPRQVWMPLALVLALAAVAAGGWWMWQSRERAPRTRTNAAVREEPAPADTPTTAQAPPSAIERAIAAAEASNQWADGLKNVLEADAELAASAIDDASRNATGPAQAALSAYAQRVAQRDDLGPQGRDGLRDLLVDCIAWEVAPQKVKIDGKVNDVTPLLADLRKRLGVKSAAKDAGQMELQSEIILRWMNER